MAAGALHAPRRLGDLAGPTAGDLGTPGTANPELQERELIKLYSLAGAIKTALTDRGVSVNAAILASQAGVTVFHVAFARWVEQNDPATFRRLMDESLEELRSVTAA